MFVIIMEQEPVLKLEQARILLRKRSECESVRNSKEPISRPNQRFHQKLKKFQNKTQTSF
jgi:hypothetical protein